MLAFWRHGYGATSVAELTAATGMHPGAIYHTFGDKQGLLLAALERYRETGVRRARNLLGGQSSPLAGLRAYLLDQVVMSQAADDRSRGCLAGNSALELLPGEPAVANAIRRTFAELHAAIAETVRAAQRHSEIEPSLPAEDVASQLLALVEGMFVLGRASASPGRMPAVVDLTLKSLRPAVSQADSQGAVP
jgi:TetR/AcrR family transcriptional regulator, transcriptional repressor for nem operon